METEPSMREQKRRHRVRGSSNTRHPIDLLVSRMAFVINKGSWSKLRNNYRTVSNPGRNFSTPAPRRLTVATPDFPTRASVARESGREPAKRQHFPLICSTIFFEASSSSRIASGHCIQIFVPV